MRRNGYPQTQKKKLSDMGCEYYHSFGEYDLRE